MQMLFTILLLSAVTGQENDISQYTVYTERITNQIYSPASQICCNGIINSPENPEEYGCCNDTIYNKFTEICCLSNIFSKTDDSKCCGMESYNFTTHVCYFDRVITRYANIYGSAKSSQGFQFTILKKDDKSERCGDKIMNLSQEVCCGGQIIPDPERCLVCCGAYTFDPRFQICCTHSIPEYPLWKTSVGDNECCGNVTYTNSKQLCVDNDLINKTEDYQHACGKETFDSRSQLCCRYYNYKTRDKNDQWYIITKSDDSHNGCCGDKSYITATDRCCQTSTTEFKIHLETNKWCCGTELYDRRSRTERCCWHTIYNPKVDTCCTSVANSQKVSKIHREKIGKCCNLQLYDGDREYCCGVNVVAISFDDQTGCCQYQLNVTHATNAELYNAIHNGNVYPPNGFHERQ